VDFRGVSVYCGLGFVWEKNLVRGEFNFILEIADLGMLRQGN
jgi:hypothetical protein